MSDHESRHQPRRDIYADITNKLIAAIEADPGKPSMPWRRSAGPLFMPVNALTGNAYNGINVVSLWVSAEAQTFSTPVWATYKQWQLLGAQVRKGEKSSPVVFYKEYEAEPDPNDSADNGKRRVARASWVFNAAQVDGYATSDAPEALGPIERLAAVDGFVQATGAVVTHGGERAFYRPSTDHIQMPPFQTFRDAASYVAVLSHETVHWTANPRRVGRDLSRYARDRSERAREELVAEIGSALLCAALGIVPELEPRPDHAGYVASWLKVLADDKRAIFAAAAHAQRAVTYLHGLQPRLDTEREAA